MKHIYLKAMLRTSCTTIHDYNQVHMKAEKICYKIGIAK